MRFSRVRLRWFSNSTSWKRQNFSLPPCAKTSMAASAAGMAFWWKGSG